ncbi:receptor-interacting protein [Carex rostrata]
MVVLQSICKPCFVFPMLLDSGRALVRYPAISFHPAIRRNGESRVIRRCKEEAKGENGSEKRTFLSLEEAGLVEMSGLSTHERFLCRLTISSLNLLRVISEQEGVAIEELNAGRVCDWFLKDKLKGEQNPESAVLQWDDPVI